LSRRPAAGDPPGDGLRLGAALRGQLKRFSAAEALQLYAFDMTVPDQQDFGHITQISAHKLKCGSQKKGTRPLVAAR